MEKDYNFWLLFEVVLVPLFINWLGSLTNEHFVFSYLSFFVCVGWAGPASNMYYSLTASEWIPSERIGGTSAGHFLIAHSVLLFAVTLIKFTIMQL